ncbi:hypothetical protein BJY00DRAFT_58932 [Aspergillus carlsbadensis]|nr:hypothetical protein BJY00DRAFT_58932 [Aspergillus carlsbadensis]
MVVIGSYDERDPGQLNAECGVSPVGLRPRTSSPGPRAIVPPSTPPPPERGVRALIRVKFSRRAGNKADI